MINHDFMALHSMWRMFYHPKIHINYARSHQLRPKLSGQSSAPRHRPGVGSIPAGGPYS